MFGSLQGRRVVPGSYTARLKTGGQTLTASVNVVMDPRVDTPPAGLQAQDELIARVDADLDDMHKRVAHLRSVRGQVQDLLKRIRAVPGEVAIEKSGKALVEKLDGLEDALVQKRVVDGQTVINFPRRLNQFYIYLRNAIDSSDIGPTEGQRARLADLATKLTVTFGDLHVFAVWELLDEPALLLGMDLLGTLPHFAVDYPRREFQFGTRVSTRPSSRR